MAPLLVGDACIVQNRTKLGHQCFAGLNQADINGCMFGLRGHNKTPAFLVASDEAKQNLCFYVYI